MVSAEEVGAEIKVTATTSKIETCLVIMVVILKIKIERLFNFISLF
jgi:hypothetical protein